MTTYASLLYSRVPAVIRTVFDICRFEQPPQALPPSAVLLAITLASYTLARMVVGWFTMPADVAALAGFIDSALLILTIVIALRVRHFSHRILQTLTACSAVGSVVTLLHIAGFSVLVMAPVPLLHLGVGHALAAPLIVWNLVLNARILREALSSGLTAGFSLALVYMVLVWWITASLVSTV
ncbi:MAG: hypothetical protein ACREWG_02605 [Gammaproteobacteria bacterium]